MLQTASNKRVSVLKRILKGGGVVAALCILLLYAVIPFILGYWATRPAKSDVGVPPSGFEEVSFQNDKNVPLKGWYKEPQNGVVILLLHGSSSSRENVRPYAEFLTNARFGILAVDLSGHGESEGQTNRKGWNGTADVRAAVKFITSRNQKVEIGALGLSMGGEILLGAVSEVPEITAVISEGATYRDFDEFYEYPRAHPIIRHITPNLMMDLSIRLFGSEDKPRPIIQSLKESRNTRILFIAAGTIKDEVDYNTMYKESVGGRGELWVIDGAGHTAGLQKVEKDYTRRVISFYENE
jgi:pimeloyl-ACP methyl ester carboxylesterase